MIAEFDVQSSELLHVSGSVIEKHGSMDSLEDEAAPLFDYYHIDFLERDLLEDTLWLGEVQTFVTYHGITVRAHTGSAAVFIALDISASVDDIPIAIQSTLDEL